MVDVQDPRFLDIPSGKRLHSNGKSPFLMGKSTISMAIFNSKLLVHQRVPQSITVVDIIPAGSGSE